MQVHCFEGVDGFWALARDQTGGALPEELGPWIFRKTVVLTREADDEREAQDLIEAHGYCCFRMQEDPAGSDGFSG